MASRLLNQAPVYLDSAGEPVASGTLYFYTTGTTTPKDVYGDKALSVNLGSTELLDSAGRQVNDIWLDGAYSVKLLDADSNLIWQRDNVETPDSLPTIGTNGQVLSSNGVTYVWADANGVPDVSGAVAGDVLTIVSGAAAWTAPVAAGDFSGGEISDGVLVNIREKTQAVTATATTTIDYALGAVVLLSQAVDITSLVFTNFGASGQAATMTIFRTKDATATARTISWGSVLFPGGTDPTLTQTTGAIDVITLICTNGTAVYGSSASAFA